MRKLCVAMLGMLAAALQMNIAMAKQAPVTADVPLSSPYYDYVEKLGAMGVADEPDFVAQPYSRLDMAKTVLSAQEDIQYVPVYMLPWLEDMAAEFAEEIAYLKGERDDLKNFQLCEGQLELGVYKGKTYDYTAGMNASYQPGALHRNGHAYGDGFNAAVQLTADGSLNKDWALGVTVRGAFDSDQKGTGSIDEAYAKTRIGNVSLIVGKQALRWGGSGYQRGFGISDNARPQTSVRLSLVEPHGFDNGFLKFLRKGNFQVFYSTLEKNRVERAHRSLGKIGGEKDGLGFVGVRAEVSPVIGWTIGAERLSIVKRFNKDWLTGKNAYEDDQWNDAGGFDTTIKLPGVHFYGSIYGEDQAGYLPTGNAFSAGVYFPQLTADGRNDLRLEYAHTDTAMYVHGTLVNGWTFYDNIVGDPMGNNANRWNATYTHYLNNGDRWALTYLKQDMKEKATSGSPVKVDMLQVTYHTRLNEALELRGDVGYGKVRNAEHKAGQDDDVKLATVTLKYKF